MVFLQLVYLTFFIYGCWTSIYCFIIYPIFVNYNGTLFFKEKNSIITILSIVFCILELFYYMKVMEQMLVILGYFSNSFIIVLCYLYSYYKSISKNVCTKSYFYSMLFCTITILIHSFFDSSFKYHAFSKFQYVVLYNIFSSRSYNHIFTFLIKAIQLIGSTSASILEH